MRVLMLSILLIVEPVAAEAQSYDPRYRVCMKVYDGPFGGEWIDCSYTSLPQCGASAAGRAATCELNPYFAHARPPGAYGPRQRAY